MFVDALFRYAGDKGFVAIRSFYEGADKPFRISSVKLSGGLQFLVDVAEDDARRAAQNPAPVVFCPDCGVAGKDRAREEDVSQVSRSPGCDERPQRPGQRLNVCRARAIVVESGGLGLMTSAGDRVCMFTGDSPGRRKARTNSPSSRPRVS
jgi:hypothetical protein